MNKAYDKGREAFKTEAYELLDELENSILTLEERPEDTELIGRVFRAMHTLKGSGGMFGFEDIESFTHDIENVFDLVRNGKIGVTKKLIDLTLTACDRIRSMMESSNDVDNSVDEIKNNEIIFAFKSLVPETDGSKEEPVKKELSRSNRDELSLENHETRATYRIYFKPNPNIFKMGTNPILLLNEIRELGDAVVIAHTKDIPELKALESELCYTTWDIILTTDQGIDAIRDVFIFVEGDCDLKIEIIDDGKNSDITVDVEMLASLIRKKGKLTKAAIGKALKKKDGKKEAEAEKNAETEKASDSEEFESTSKEMSDIKQDEKNRQRERIVSSIRVPAKKLDDLVNLVGELVITQSRLSQIASSREDPDLTLLSEDIERLTAELRENSMNIRMIPMGTTFSKFKRLVRDLSHEQGKEIDLIVQGAETELDKTVIEKLNDPLVHIIRNCIDHGIEQPALRTFARKPQKGSIRLSAVHSGADVVIKVEDDGAGLDSEAIHRKAMEKGLVSPEIELSQNEMLRLIFTPGFTTKEGITSISGRGVGMDVVKRNIEDLRGSVDVYSRKSIGTTITIKLPLTLGIIEGLLVRIAEDSYVFPLSVVEECVELIHENGKYKNGHRFLDIRGHAVPYIRLRDQFDMAEGIPEIEQVLITQTNGQRVGFAVDQILGEQQIVIKSLGKAYKDVDCLTGATVLGDGTVALILDVPKLVEKAVKEEAEKCI